MVPIGKILSNSRILDMHFYSQCGNMTMRVQSQPRFHEKPQKGIIKNSKTGKWESMYDSQEIEFLLPIKSFTKGKFETR